MLHQIKPIASKNTTADQPFTAPADLFTSTMGSDGCLSCFGTGTHITDRGLVRCHVCGGSGRKGA